MNKKIPPLIAFLIYVICLPAQVKQEYNFEDNSQNWATQDTLLWQMVKDTFNNNTASLSYSLPKNTKLPGEAILSIDTKIHTIMKVRTAQDANKRIIIGSDYNGKIIAANYDGIILWKQETGTGTMNHDLWCDDITGDNIDEIIAANANGKIYCYTIEGKKLWEFQPFKSNHLTPMYAVCAVSDQQKNIYIVCGDYTSSIYYLSPEGKLVKTIHSTKYSKVRGWGSDKPRDYYSVSNFLRPLPLSDGSDLLVVHTNNNHMQTDGEIHLMKPLAEKSQCYIGDPKTGDPLGELRVVDGDEDGRYELLLGSSSLNDQTICKVSFNDTYTQAQVSSHTISWRNTGVTSYRVNQPFIFKSSDNYDIGVLSSNQLLKYSSDDNYTLKEKLSGTFTYNDMWQDNDGRIILASSQDGGSCIHIIDTENNAWKDEFRNLMPIGKISSMMENAKKVRSLLASWQKPSWQREPVLVTGLENDNLPIASKISGSNSLRLLDGVWNNKGMQEPSWRSPIYDNSQYKDTTEGRVNYTRTEEFIYNFFTPFYSSGPGISTWAGHGNDPLYYSLKLLKDIADYGYNNGDKQTIYVYPEMNQHGNAFDIVMDNQIYPLADHMQGIGGKIAFRPKNIFWQGVVYTDSWKEILSGKYADLAIPMLEETTDKTQDLSLLGRMGLWTAGSVDAWAVRCSRDDPSFDRSRQFSSQKLSNHFLRKTIFSLACGASYIHNSYPDKENSIFEWHSSLALELIQKEALYVPKREEILSFNPVHLSITSPQASYLNEAENHKWITNYNRTYEESHPAVFSHMNATWLGASVCPWDFSAYANGVIDRRQNAIPSYPNGTVLITPVQEGTMADKDAPRGKLTDHLHPLYKDIMSEYITDGVDYISKDGTQRYKANSYYTQIQKEIEEKSKLLPISVSGDKVGWVVAQVSPTHLRLTLIDGGWLDPNNRKVKVVFNTITPVKVQDILDQTSYEVDSESCTEIDIPCGMFRFIDIELTNPL